MNENLALKTISDQLKWDNSEAKREFEWLKLLSAYKYDAYEGYEPGSRFYVSLIGWLKQFESIDDRKVAYAFLKNNLIFFSRREIVHLVHRYWPVVQRTIIKSVADDLKIPTWMVMADPKGKEAFAIQLRQSLFVGISDGAKMDVFRRDNEGRISNEQTVIGHEMSKEKWKSMVNDDLAKDLTKNGWIAEPVFKHLFLIDDFTASGTSLIRKKDDGTWAGKIPKFIDQTSKDHLDKLHSPCKVHIHHYIATRRSVDAVTPLVDEFVATLKGFEINLSFGLILDEKCNVSAADCKDFYNLLGKHYDKSVQTDISLCVQYGYKECELAVVLEHNTPNNSVALIWAETKEEDVTKTATPMSPLFRRRTRHA
jgi:hypothetical protein